MEKTLTSWPLRMSERGEKKERNTRKESDTFLLIHWISGAGESGKSTVLKQMKWVVQTLRGHISHDSRIIHDAGFSAEESAEKRNVVCANTIQAMGALLDGMKQLRVDFSNRICNVSDVSKTEAVWESLKRAISGAQKCIFRHMTSWFERH